MKLTEAADRSFARHETFHPRYSWFRKAYAHVERDGGIFGRVDAPVKIGVGKNMVRAIRFWGLAAKLIAEDPQHSGRRQTHFVPTRRGYALFGHGRWDPYMEDPGTLWLLHWLLLAPKSQLPVWWLAFNEFNAVEFSESDLQSAASTLLEAASAWAVPHPKSLNKDVSALLRTYAPAEKTARSRIDDMLDCPLRELNLLNRSPATGRFRFTLGSKPTLPSSVVAYAALDYVALTGSHGNTITMSHLIHEPGAPGRAFKLTEAEMVETLRPSMDGEDRVNLTTSTGAVQFTWSGDPAAIATSILDRYYAPKSPLAPMVCAGPEGNRPVEDSRLEDDAEQSSTAAVRPLATAGAA